MNWLMQKEMDVIQYATCFDQQGKTTEPAAVPPTSMRGSSAEPLSKSLDAAPLSRELLLRLGPNRRRSLDVAELLKISAECQQRMPVNKIPTAIGVSLPVQNFQGWPGSLFECDVNFRSTNSWNRP